MLPKSPKKPTFNFSAQKEKSTKRTSLDNEKRLSEEVGFTCTPGSGNQKWAHSKGDGISEGYLYECKETSKKNITIKGADIEKHVREAAAIGRIPAFIFSIYGLSDHIPKDWIAVPAEDFEGHVVVDRS